MEVAAMLALFEGALTLVERMKPIVQDWFKRGEVPVEDQKRINEKMEKLRGSGFAFTRPPGS